MVKVFPIDFVRQALEQKMLIEHLANPNYFGGKNQVSILSFYEQLKSPDEVDRFVETYRDLTEQQNRTGLILNGVLVSPENPTITNLYSSLIIPMSWTCSLRCTLENRDQSLETINNLIGKLKGRKVDIAQLKCKDENNKTYYAPFVVGTIGQNEGETKLKNGDFIGTILYEGNISDKLLSYFDALELTNNNTNYMYCEYENKIKVINVGKGSALSPLETTVIDYDTDNRDYITNVYIKIKDYFQYTSLLKPLLNGNSGTVRLNFYNDTYADVECDAEIIKYEYVDGYPEITINLKTKERYKDDDLEEITNPTCELYYKSYDFVEDDGTYGDIIFPQEHESFEKYKLSFSFDAIRCDEPRNLNGKEYCELSFGGSATLVNNSVKLGNDLIKVGIKRNNIIKSNGSNAFNDAFEYLEPLEMPSGNNANTQISQLVSNHFKTNTHTDGIALTLQYTFIADESFNLINKWFDYARYGDQSYITPNIIYSVNEIWSSWGNYVVKNIKTKLVENVEIENTESDTLTLSVNMQIQGDNH